MRLVVRAIAFALDHVDSSYERNIYELQIRDLFSGRYQENFAYFIIIIVIIMIFSSVQVMSAFY